MVSVHCVHVVSFSLLHGILGVRQLQGRPAAESIAILRQPQLLPRGLAALLLNEDGTVGRLQGQEAGVHLGPDLEGSGTDGPGRTLYAGLCIRLERPPEMRSGAATGPEWPDD